MKTLFSVYTIFAFLTETLNASKQRNNKIIWQKNSTYQNNDDYTIDGFDYLSFAKIFLSQSELSQPPKIEILQSEPSIIIDNSTICSEEVDFSALEFLGLNKAIEVPMNNPIPSNPSISKNIKRKGWLCLDYENMLYKKTHEMMSDIPSFNLFFFRKISQKNLNDVNHESILIIKEELLSLIFTSNSTDNCNENNYYDDDLDEKNILENLKKKIQSSIPMNRLEWLEKITEYICLNPFKNIENTKINLLFPELNFLQNFSKKTIISLITYSIPLNNDKVVKYKSCDKKSVSKNLIDKKIFFTRILLSELFYSFQKTHEKIRIYRLLNTLYYFSTVTIKKGKYFRISLFELKLRFIFRFLFDKNIRIEDGFKNDLFLCIICQLTNPSASKLIQRRLFALICSHCSVNIYMDKATALVNIYRDKFCGNKRLETIFNQEAQNIINLKESINSMDFSQNKHDNDIQVLKILLDLEFRISHIEKAILGNSILFMSCYAKRGYEFTYNSIIKQAEEYYKDSHFSKEYFSIL
ncbi:hypothetical protein CWI39_0320p0010 [Hamiltosporidium magnivora]|uniref:Uncharacterized protein n=1 Tax=Hamiltosporidium magnivora TaxID=148818 RepID=A0A4V2JWC6_9MICR|nr:hypothetical protein CWI39_0320p0010 [Hamiltosporidium magnivora]